MKMIKGKETLGTVIFLMVISSPVWLISGFMLSSKLHSMFGVRHASSFLVLLGMGIPFGLIILWGLKRIAKLNAQRVAMVNETRRGDTDYYHCTKVNSIAISTATRIITVYRSKRMFKTGGDVRFEIPVEKLRYYRAHAPGYTTVETNGPAVTQGADALIDGFRNAKSKAAADLTTGLYLELDDVMNPEIFVRMDFEDAKKWFLLFEKLCNGTLEKQQPAMFYPRESCWAPV